MTTRGPKPVKVSAQALEEVRVAKRSPLRTLHLSSWRAGGVYQGAALIIRNLRLEASEGRKSRIMKAVSVGTNDASPFAELLLA